MAKNLLSILDDNERKDWLLKHGVIAADIADYYLDSELYVKEVGFKAGYGEAIVLMLLHNVEYSEILDFYQGESYMDLGARSAVNEIKRLRNDG